MNQLAGNVRDTLRQIQEVRTREGEPLNKKAIAFKFDMPDAQSELVEIRRVGVFPLLRNSTPIGPRLTGYPHNADQSEMIVGEFRNDVSHGRMCVSPNDTLDEDCIISAPSTLAAKKLPDRAISEDAGRLQKYGLRIAIALNSITVRCRGHRSGISPGKF